MRGRPLTSEQMQDLYCDPAVGDIKRRALKRALSGVKAIGPSGPPVILPQPTAAERAETNARVAADHNKTVEAEVAALDKHAEDVARRVELLAGTSVTFAEQELRTEARQLRELRMMIEADLDHPITVDRDGRPLDDRDRAICRLRTRELAASKWAEAARADAEGDRRRGRQLRRDALRARQIAEHEAGWRRNLPGYGISPWT